MTIGVKRILTEKIDTLQTYYGNAIRGHKQDLKGMREAVWAIYFHYRSTDDIPVHSFCGDWCSYKQAVVAGNVDEYKHTRNLPVPVMDAIKPVFKDLAKTELLKKCLEGYTQNANESMNSVIWRLCPKNRYHGLTVVQAAVSIAVSIFNDGATSLLDIMKEMGLSPGCFARKFCEDKDFLRINNAQRQATAASFEARRAKRRRRLALEEQQEEAEGCPYQAGGH